MNFSSADCNQLAELGIPTERAERQLTQLRKGQTWAQLSRACIAGDGILQISPEQRAHLSRQFDQAVVEGRLTRFVPASGAATRMFKALYADAPTLTACCSTEPAVGAAKAELELRRFLDQLPHFAFQNDLANAMRRAGHDLEQARQARQLELIIRFLLEPCGLDYASLPKGLLAFHGQGAEVRTPFVEHLAEAALLAGPDQTVSLHFTVSPQHLPLFEAQFQAWRERLEQTYGCRLQVSYSVQKPTTDTLAILDDDQPLRDAQGRLQLRPGGHGALIENLNDLAGDLIQIRNIDNVVPDTGKQPNLAWTRILGGYLLELQAEQFALLRALNERTGDPFIRDLSIAFLVDRLQAEVSADADEESLIALLDRPLRVCGMVPNSGEPGGGPFWVRDTKGRLSRQIVESSQINQADPEQLAVLHNSTHFNPVDMLCAVRDWRGRPFDLTRFVDDEAVIITGKSQAGQALRVLELPGLWNGAMAHWHTLFVEIPPACFNPVKTVFDLLRPRTRYSRSPPVARTSLAGRSAAIIVCLHWQSAVDRV